MYVMERARTRACVRLLVCILLFVLVFQFECMCASVAKKTTGDFCGIHGIGKILFVGKNEKDCVSELVLVQHPVEFFSSFADSLSVIAVDHEDQTLASMAT